MAEVSRIGAPNQFTLHTTRLLAEGGLRALGGLGVGGKENIIAIEGAYVQAANHRSMLDIPVLGAAAHRSDRQQLHYLAKEELNVPALGKWLESAGTFYVDRQKGLSLDDMEYVASLVRQNAALAIWPEGHRNSGPIQREHLKAMIIAPLVFEHGLTVVPVGVEGTEPGNIGFFELTYGKPIAVEKIEFEADPEWDARRRIGMLTRAIGKDSLAGFMDDLYIGMSAAQAESAERRAERMARRRLARTILMPLNMKKKDRKPLSFSGS